MLPYAIERDPHELLPVIPPSVHCADVLTSTGNHRPCGFSHAVERVEDDARLDGHGARVAVEGDDAVEVFAVVDDECGADRLPALGAAGAARQERDLELAADVEGRAHVGVGTRDQHADRLDLVDRGVRRVTAARRTVEQHVAGDGTAQAPREFTRGASGHEREGLGLGCVHGRGGVAPGR